MAVRSQCQGYYKIYVLAIHYYTCILGHRAYTCAAAAAACSASARACVYIILLYCSSARSRVRTYKRLRGREGIIFAPNGRGAAGNGGVVSLTTPHEGRAPPLTPPLPPPPPPPPYYHYACLILFLSIRFFEGFFLFLMRFFF